MKVKRYNWFDINGQTTRWTESTSNESECDHQVCNCTKSVKDRPEGIPEAINTHVSDVFTIGDVSIDLDLLPSFWFRIYWTDVKNCNAPHTYLMLNRDGFRVEHYSKGWSNVDYFFGNIYFGNRVDISKLMNGHSPSRVIELHKLRAQDVWIHDCNWGKEDYKVMEPGVEANTLWWTLYSMALYVQQRATKQINDSKSVDTIRHNLECDYGLNGDIWNLVQDTYRVFAEFENTNFFKLQTEIRDNIKPSLSL